MRKICKIELAMTVIPCAVLYFTQEMYFTALKNIQPKDLLILSVTSIFTYLLVSALSRIIAPEKKLHIWVLSNIDDIDNIPLSPHIRFVTATNEKNARDRAYELSCECIKPEPDWLDETKTSCMRPGSKWNFSITNKKV